MPWKLEVLGGIFQCHHTFPPSFTSAMPVKTSNSKLDNDSFCVLFYLGLENIRGRETMRLKKKCYFHSLFHPLRQIFLTWNILNNCMQYRRKKINIDLLHFILPQHPLTTSNLLMQSLQNLLILPFFSISLLLPNNLTIMIVNIFSGLML